MRMTTRRSVGRLTSVKPAAANMPAVPTWSSPRMASFVVIGYPSTARAPRCLAKSTVAWVSAAAMPRLRKPARVTKQVTAQTLPSVLSSSRSSHGTRLLRSKRGYSVRGSTAHQPTGSPSRKATRPLVASDPGWPQSVCCRRRKASSSGPTDAHDSPGCILDLWHQHLDGSPRASQTAWVAGVPVDGGDRRLEGGRPLPQRSVDLAHWLAGSFEHGFVSASSLTVGVEEELLLVDPVWLLPADRVESVLALVEGDQRFTAEL